MSQITLYMKNKKKRTEISELGKFGLIEELTSGFTPQNSTTIHAVGDDAAVIERNKEEYTLLSTKLMLEGVDFDLVYFPLKHLGYKAVVAALGNILAMNGTPEQLTVSLGVSAKLSVEHLKELYEGIKSACELYEVDLVGGETNASLTGLALGLSVVGRVEKSKIAYRSGAGETDLICITGNLGAAYMGLHLLEREKRVLEGHPDPQPQFEGYEYILRRQLQPQARLDVIQSLAEEGVVPTSMIDLTDGLAGDLLQICRKSNCGCRIYLDRIPVARETNLMAAELNADPIVAALNGGDDHELLFTVPVEFKEKLVNIGGLDIIGHITAQNTGAFMVTPDQDEIQLKAPGIQ